MDRLVCIHGHFYQPPRENPWLEAIELQDSAYPYHDWNERIAAECYAANAASRIHDGDGRIVRIVNNYAKISFDFGPTLLMWLEQAEPDTYRAVIEADRESQALFSGHGSALAQAYNHIILPLANQRDKWTQVLWGMRDFEHRFGRKPEGMWLPETAVDVATLEVLAELGIRFTILAPHQARRVRPLEGGEWEDVSDGRIDPSRAYSHRLPSGRSIALFFYDGPISRAVAFEGLLANGEQFVGRLLNAFSPERTWPQLAHIATDGESYGHHHRNGDMALAYAVEQIEAKQLARTANYGEFLEKYPPTHEVEVAENTAWSCAHGIDRWRADCGCHSGSHSGWNQAWRTPLREALDWLRDTLASEYESKLGELVNNPWHARDDYIRLILDRSVDSQQRFFADHANRPLTEVDRLRALQLLEMQRHAMLMYTSCGWFFDDISGIETVQVIEYAGRAIQLAEEIFPESPEPGFLELLERAASNVPEHRNGRHVYDRFVKPAIVDLRKVCAHYAVSSLFEPYGGETPVYCYLVEREDYECAEAGRLKLAIGHARVTSRITNESGRFSFGVLHFGDHNLNCGVREYRGRRAYSNLVQTVKEAFVRADLPDVIRRLDRHFQELAYSVKSLFRDEQRKVMNLILESTLADIEGVYRQVYDHYAPLMRFMKDLGIPLPAALRAAAELVLSGNITRTLRNGAFSPDRLQALMEQAAGAGVSLNETGLGYLVGQVLGQMLRRFAADPSDLDSLEKIAATVELVGSLPFKVDLWNVQNIYYEMMKNNYPGFNSRAAGDDEAARAWVDRFRAIGRTLQINVE